MSQWIDDFTPKPYTPQWLDDPIPPPQQPTYQPPPPKVQEQIPTFMNPPMTTPAQPNYQAPPAKEPGFFEQQFTWPNAVRMGLSTAGDYVGGLLAPVTFGLAYPALSFAGGALGELSGQAMEGKSPNWGLIGTEGALNLIPGPNIPGKGALAKDIAKFGVKAAGSGAVQGLVGATPRHIAETGNWELPSVGETLGQTAVGGLAGGVTGLGLAGGHQLLNKMMPSLPSAAAPPPPPESGSGVIEPRASDIPVGQPPPQGPSVVTIKDSSQIAYWKSKGYVIVPGLRSADDYPQMVPGNAAPMFKAPPPADTPPPPPTDTFTKETVPGPIGEGYAPADTKEVSIPNDIANDVFIQNMKESGFLLDTKDATHTHFKAGVEEATAPPNMDELWAKLKSTIGPEAQRTDSSDEVRARLRQMMGREPTSDEVYRATRAQARPGEPTGGIARFDDRFVAEEDQGIYNTPTDPAKLQEFASNLRNDINNPNYIGKGGAEEIQNATTREQLEDLYNVWKGALDETRNKGMTQSGNKAVEMIQLIRQKYKEIQASQPPVRPDVDLPQHPDLDLQEIQQTKSYEEAQKLYEFWRQKMDEFKAQGHTQAEMHASGMASMTAKRMQEFVSGPSGRGPRVVDPILDRMRGQTPPEGAQLGPRALDIPESGGGLDVSAIRQRNLLGGQSEPPFEEPSFQKTKLTIGEKLRQALGVSTPAPTPVQPPPVQPSVPVETPILVNNPVQTAIAAGGLRTKGLKINADIRRMAKNITRDYTSPLEGIMVREGVQNGMDAADKLGEHGRVHIRISEHKTGQPNFIEVYDNGSGMDETALDGKLATLFATGKEGEEGATGGKGIGSASYMLGGDHFTIESIAVDSIDGKKYKIISSGTPDELLSGDSAWDKTEVPMETPTGTKIKVLTTSEQQLSRSKRMISDIAEHSRDRPSKLIVDKYAIGNKDISEISSNSDSLVDTHKISSSADDKVVGDFDFNNSNIKIQIPEFDPDNKVTGFNIHYLNNGMFQFSERESFNQATKGLPDNVIVNIRPLVDDLHPDYPFINTREDVKKDLRRTVTKYIQDNISGPAVQRRKNRVQELYDSMTHVQVAGMNRKTVIYDPGERLTPAELKAFSDNPATKALLAHYDELIHNIVASTGRQNWADRLEGVGIVLEPTMNGVHIPNPSTAKSTILINPFARMDAGESVNDNAWKNTITNLHETAHIGDEAGQPIQLTPKDLADPRVGEFFQTYLNQLVDHGDVGFGSTGHGMGFGHRLGEVFSTYGVENTYESANQLRRILGDKSGGYRPEVQELLRIYQESRGRPETTEDLLSPTGIKQANRKSSGAGNIPGATQANGNRVPPPVPPPGSSGGGGFFRGKLGWGQGATKGGSRTGKDDVNWVREMANVPSAVTTTGDLSFPGRQGLTLIATPQFWQAAGKMFKGGLSQAAFDAMNDELAKKPLMAKRLNTKTGKWDPGLGEELGLKIYKLASQAGPHSEGISSRWLERGIGRTTKDALGNKTWHPTTGSKLWSNTFGMPIRAANRAFLTMLNHLSVDRAQFLMDKARDMSIEGLQSAHTSPTGVGSIRPGIFSKNVNKNEAMDMNPYYNHVLGKEIIDFVNTATGHGPLRTHVLPAKQTEVSLEGASKVLSAALFSPGLLSRTVRFMNPSTYIMASPYVRKQYLKSALSVTAAWFAFTEMAKLAGGNEVEVNNEITSADFGKVRIGDTRLDPGGGFLQFAVAYGRLYQGGSTSSSTGQFHKFGEGYQAQTSEDMMERFMVNKLNPVMKFAYDIASASEYNPFHLGDRTLQMFTPLIAQDLMEIYKENPTLLPAMGTAAMFGMGTQIYSKGESVGKLIPPENDILLKGQAGKDFMPWNWGAQ